MSSGKKLPVMEEFYSLQGEGYHTGKAAYFVRIGGCDNGCWWCDVKESWDASIHKMVEVDQIVERALLYPARSVVVTGGEPLLYDLDYLCIRFHEAGYRLFLETSGSEPISGSWDWICLSPKPLIPPLPEYYHIAHELKVIITQPDDFEWAETVAGKVGNDCKLFLQPEWSRRGALMNKVVEFIKQHPHWRMSLQSHKYMNIP